MLGEDYSVPQQLTEEAKVGVIDDGVNNEFLEELSKEL